MARKPIDSELDRAIANLDLADEIDALDEPANEITAIAPRPSFAPRSRRLAAVVAALGALATLAEALRRLLE